MTEPNQLTFLHNSCKYKVNNIKQTFNKTKKQLINKHTNSLTNRSKEKNKKTNQKLNK